MSITAAIFDLDGVVRHNDAELQHRIETDHGLPGGAIRRAFEPEILRLALSGEIGRAEWADRVGAAVGSDDAARAWRFAPAIVDPEAVALVEDLRATGTVVAVMTNGVDTLDAELDQDGLSSTFDHVLNSAATGLLKPDPAAFLHACRCLGAKPAAVFFTDDSPKNVEGARTAELRAFEFRGVEATRRELEIVGALRAQSGSA